MIFASLKVKTDNDDKNDVTANDEKRELLDSEAEHHRIEQYGRS